jgi:sugar/nucleoside kinase (ribokinase family)
MLDVVTMGEVMVQLNAMSNGPLRHVTHFEKHAAGAEGSFAIGMSRLGFKAGFITRVRDDEFGKYVVSLLRSEGIEVSRVKTDSKAPNGVYFIQRNYPIPGKSSVIYYRKDSAASEMSPEDVDPEYIKNAKLLHITGITPALSESCKEATFKALEVASQANVRISVDTNIRLRLWSEQEARETLMAMLEKANIVLIEPQDAEILIGKTKPENIAENLLSMRAETVVVKLGEEGATAFTENKSARKPAFKVPVVDVIGAGDAFAAGFISSLMRGWDLERALEVGNAAGALVVTVRGDFENMPNLDDIEKFLAAQRKQTVILR